MLGSVTVRKVCKPQAPSVSAASSSAVPCSCISGISSRATNGKVTNIVASTMPGTAKMIWMPCAREPRPEAALRAEEQHVDRPETTGDTENGRSISVISRLLPRKSNLAIAQAAARPKTGLSGTAIAATSSVSRIAATRVGLGERREIARRRPCASASANTTASGSDRNSAEEADARRRSAASARSGALAGDGSRAADATVGDAQRQTWPSLLPAPGLHEVDRRAA